MKEKLQKQLQLLNIMLEIGFSSDECKVAINALRKLWGLEQIMELIP